ncbi:MAG: hypothetical protein O3C21_10350, partial [Verrucomicrobia bacterium]|nr:hypothetical protein [Verrucomicrobiota bacterium]
VDRVFVSPKPIREMLSYLRHLDLLASGRISLFPPGAIVVYARSPHYPWEVLFARRAELMGHRVCVIQNIFVNNRIRLEEGTDFYRPTLLRVDRVDKSSCDEKISIDDLKSQFLEDSKLLMQDVPLNARFAWWVKLIAWFTIPAFNFNWAKKVALDRKNQSIFSRTELLVALFGLRRQKRAAVALLRRSEIFPSDLLKFVLVALHYQPEATTEPQGGPFSDQSLFVKEIREALNALGRTDIEVLVREHPRQVARGIPALGEVACRSVGFYKAISDMEGVQLVASSISMPELVQRALLVATVNGTAAWEALQAGRPAITGRPAWYGDCQAVRTLGQIQARPKELHDLLRLSPQDVRSALDNFLGTENYTFFGANNSSDISAERAQWQEFADLMVDGIMDRVQQSALPPG